MIDINTDNLIGQGSNSKVYCCYFKGVEYAAKVPCSLERYISFLFQVDSLLLCKDYKTSFLTPNVIRYEQCNAKYGEILILERFKNIYPIDFLIKNGLVVNGYIISSIAEAVAELHSLGISGFDIEFYWSYEFNKLVLLDLGPRYSVGYNSREMIKKHYDYAVSKKNWMSLWNIISELLSADKIKGSYDQIIVGKNIPPLDELQDAVSEGADQEHIQGVARNHFLQLLGEYPNNLQKKAVSLFIRKYCSSTSTPSYAYINAFKNAYKQHIKSNSVRLYMSKYDTLSKMSNSVSIK